MVKATYQQACIKAGFHTSSHGLAQASERKQKNNVEAHRSAACCTKKQNRLDHNSSWRDIKRLRIPASLQQRSQTRLRTMRVTPEFVRVHAEPLKSSYADHHVFEASLRDACGKRLRLNVDLDRFLTALSAEPAGKFAGSEHGRSGRFSRARGLEALTAVVFALDTRALTLGGAGQEDELLVVFNSANI